MSDQGDAVQHPLNLAHQRLIPLHHERTSLSALVSVASAPDAVGVGVNGVGHVKVNFLSLSASFKYNEFIVSGASRISMLVRHNGLELYASKRHLSR